MMTLLVSEQTKKELADPVKGYVHRPIYFAIKGAVDKVNEKYANVKEDPISMMDFWKYLEETVIKNNNIHPFGDDSFRIIYHQAINGSHAFLMSDKDDFLIQINFNLKTEEVWIDDINSDAECELTINETMSSAIEQLQHELGLELGTRVVGYISDLVGSARHPEVPEKKKPHTVTYMGLPADPVKLYEKLGQELDDLNKILDSYPRAVGTTVMVNDETEDKIAFICNDMVNIINTIKPALEFVDNYDEIKKALEDAEKMAQQQLEEVARAKEFLARYNSR